MARNCCRIGWFFRQVFYQSIQKKKRHTNVLGDWKINIGREIRSSSQLRVTITILWNHHLEKKTWVCIKTWGVPSYNEACQHVYGRLVEQSHITETGKFLEEEIASNNSIMFIDLGPDQDLLHSIKNWSELTPKSSATHFCDHRLGRSGLLANGAGQDVVGI